MTRKQCDLKKKLRVTFVGEAGLDLGGLTKEWFLLLVRQVFHTDYGETRAKARLSQAALEKHFLQHLKQEVLIRNRAEVSGKTSLN